MSRPPKDLSTTIKVVRSSKPSGPFGSTRSRVGESACTRMSPTMISSLFSETLRSGGALAGVSAAVSDAPHCAVPERACHNRTPAVRNEMTERLRYLCWDEGSQPRGEARCVISYRRAEIAGTTMRKKAYSSSPSRVQLLGCRQASRGRWARSPGFNKPLDLKTVGEIVQKILNKLNIGKTLG